MLHFNLVFDGKTKFPNISELIKVDHDLHKQLQENGMGLPCPQWFIEGRYGELNKMSYLENSLAYIENTATFCALAYGLLNEFYQYVMAVRPQSDPIKRFPH